MFCLRQISKVFVFTFLLGCTQQQAPTTPVNEFQLNGLRPLSAMEAVEDFREMANYFRIYYGPKAFKEKRFNFKFEALVKGYEGKVLKAKGDDEIFGLYAQFISTFQDGHVGIQFSANSTGFADYSVPIFVTPVEDKFLVAAVNDLKGTNLAVGDEVLKVDDKSVEDYLKIILKYRALATPESNRHWVIHLFSRPFYMTEIVPKNNFVKVEFTKPDGRTFVENFVWKANPTNSEKYIEDIRGFTVPMIHEFNKIAHNSILGMSHPKSFFATENTLSQYKFRQVTANEEFRKKYGLADTDKPDIYAYLYKFEGKSILLVRNFSYSHHDFSNVTYMKAYKAILDQWQDLADVLVLDQTHNGGGSYCEEFFRLFIQEEKDGFVQALNVDRKWITDLRSEWGKEVSKEIGADNARNRVFEAMGSVVEAAYDRGEKMTTPLPIIGGKDRVAPADFTWKKPMLVLVDELAGSCGDAFPMLIKNNNVAKLFGKRTMGLGGNVESFTLTHSRTAFRMTRGLFTSHRADKKYTDDLLIENNGVTPDYLYEHTVDDFRSGFVGYVRAFSEQAIKEIK